MVSYLSIESDSAEAPLSPRIQVRETLWIHMLTGLAKYNVEGIDVHVSRIYYSFESGTMRVCCLQI